LRAILFDFDGTLADTAPDLGRAVNRMRVERGMAELPIETVRPYASSGARGLLKIAFGITGEDPQFPRLRDEFLAHYDTTLCVETRLFAGVPELLAEIERRGMAWGIVTNKATRFTHRIVAALGLAERAGCVVCGDTTQYIKPHPAPLLHAAQALALPPEVCCYLGDDLRDVQAAHAAGMSSVAVEWGYHGTENGGPRCWNAGAVIAQPKDLIQVL
jgi:phosphoglycolate phosphatase